MQTERDEDHPHAVWQKYRRVDLQTMKVIEEHLHCLFGPENALIFLEAMNSTPFMFVYYFAEEDKRFISRAEWEAAQTR